MIHTNFVDIILFQNLFLLEKYIQLRGKRNKNHHEWYFSYSLQFPNQTAEEINFLIHFKIKNSFYKWNGTCDTIPRRAGARHVTWKDTQKDTGRS